MSVYSENSYGGGIDICGRSSHIWVIPQLERAVYILCQCVACRWWQAQYFVGIIYYLHIGQGLWSMKWTLGVHIKWFEEWISDGKYCKCLLEINKFKSIKSAVIYICIEYNQGNCYDTCPM